MMILNFLLKYNYLLFFVSIGTHALAAPDPGSSCEAIRTLSHFEMAKILLFRENLISNVDQCLKLQANGPQFETCYQTALDQLTFQPSEQHAAHELEQQKIIEAVIESRFYILAQRTLGYDNILYNIWYKLRLGVLKGKNWYTLTEVSFKNLESAINNKFKQKRSYLTRVMAIESTLKPELSDEYSKLQLEEGAAQLQMQLVREIVRQESLVNSKNRYLKTKLTIQALEGITGTLGFLYVVYYGRNIFNPVRNFAGPIAAGCSLGAVGGSAVHLIEKTAHSFASAYKNSFEHQTSLTCEWSKTLTSTGEQWQNLLKSAAFGSASGCLIIGAAIVAPKTTTVALTGALGASLIQSGNKTTSALINAEQELKLAKELSQIINSVQIKYPANEMESQQSQQSQNPTAMPNAIKLGLTELTQARELLIQQRQQVITIENTNNFSQHILMAHKYFADAGESAVQTALAALLMRNYLKSFLDETAAPDLTNKSEEQIKDLEIEEAFKQNPKSGKATKALSQTADNISHFINKVVAKLGHLSISGTPNNPEVTAVDSSYIIFKDLWKLVTNMAEPRKSDEQEQSKPHEQH